jgi:phosphatidylglycerophosphate synthase
LSSFESEKSAIYRVTRGGGCYYPSIRLLIHPVSTRLTFLLAKTSVTPNMVTGFTTFVSILSLVAFVRGDYVSALVLYWARVVLDYTDGSLARYRCMESGVGAKLDLWMDIIFFGATWVTFAREVPTPGAAAMTVLAPLAYTLVVQYYVVPRLGSLTRRVPTKAFFMDRGILIGFAPFGVFEFWAFFFFAVRAPAAGFVVLPMLLCIDGVYRVYEIIRFGRGR